MDRNLEDIVLNPANTQAREVLQQLRKDMDYVEDEVVPFLRGRGRKELTTREILAATPADRKMYGPFMTWTGKRMSVNVRKFVEWWLTTPEGMPHRAETTRAFTRGGMVRCRRVVTN